MIEYFDADPCAALTRRWPTPFGLFGEWTMPEFSCFTLERPWLDNAPRVSCIPAATYQIGLSHFYRGDYPCLEILNVPERSLIKVHGGVLMRHSIGCVLVGRKFGYIDGQWSLQNSRATLRELLDVWRQYKVDVGSLEVKWDLNTEGPR